MVTPADVRARRIAEWVDRVVRTRSYEKFDDLHVDEIDPALSNPADWLAGGVECLTAAIAYLEAAKLPYSATLVFSLQSDDEPANVHESSLGDVAKIFDHSPPSLYLFPRGREPWAIDEDFRIWRGSLTVPSSRPLSAFVCQFFADDSEEYRASFWIVTS